MADRVRYQPEEDPWLGLRRRDGTRLKRPQTTAPTPWCLPPRPWPPSFSPPRRSTTASDLASTPLEKMPVDSSLFRGKPPVVLMHGVDPWLYVLSMQTWPLHGAFVPKGAPSLPGDHDPWRQSAPVRPPFLRPLGALDVSRLVAIVTVRPLDRPSVIRARVNE